MWLDRYDTPELVLTAADGVQLYTAIRGATGERELVAVGKAGSAAVPVIDRLARVLRAIDHAHIPKVLERAHAGDIELVALACNAVIDAEALRSELTNVPFEYPHFVGFLDTMFDAFEACHRVPDPDDGLPICVGRMSASNVLVGEHGELWTLFELRTDPTKEVAAPEVITGMRPTPASDLYALWSLSNAYLSQTAMTMNVDRFPPLLRSMVQGERGPQESELRELLQEAQTRALDYAPERRASFDELRAILRRMWKLLGAEPDLAGWSQKMGIVVRGVRAHRAGSPTAPSKAARGGAPACILARYELTDVIGAGGMGTVFDAWDRQLGQRVVVKRLKDSAEWDLRERFAREVRILRTVQHPNLVRGFDLVEEGGALYAIMEHVGGVSLEAYLATESDPRTVLDMLAGVADGLASLHDAKIVHRDVKPSNIIVHATRGAVLLDYGIAYEAGSDLTRADAVLGTPQYMSPEQHAGAEPEPSSDIYALGLVALRCLVGAAGTPEERLAKLPAALQDVLRPCFGERTARPTAKVLAAALRAAPCH